MMHYKDLSTYEYLTGAKNAGMVNIGWLEKGHSFPTGQVSMDIIHTIGELCTHPVHKTRGYHTCSLCKNTESPIVVVFKDKTFRLGSSEIHVKRNNGITYAAPDLIYHYIKDHHYLPPEDFLIAIKEYKNHLNSEIGD